MSKKSAGFFLGAIFGAAAGAVAGLFLAPRSGEETRPLLYAFICDLLLACLVKFVLEVREHLAHASKLHAKTLSGLVCSGLCR